MKQQIAFEKFSPFRRPDWRFTRVLQMTATPTPGRSTVRDDEYVKKFRHFYLKHLSYNDNDEARQKLAYADPGVAWAFQIYDQRQTASRKSTAIEARILAGLTDEAIADELHTIPDVVRWYEAMFFNVRDRLRSSDWVVDHVLIPAYEAGTRVDEGEEDDANPLPLPTFQQPRTPLAEPFFDATIKMFGYFGGPVILDYMLAGGFRKGAVAQGADDLSSWWDGHTFTRLRNRSAMASQTFEVNKYNVMELFQTHLRIMELEQAAETGAGQQNQIFGNIAAMLKNMPWAIGDKGQHLVRGTLVEPYDDSAAELRDDELQLLSSGKKPRTIKGIELMKLPPPRQTNGQEDQSHANAQQGR